MCELYPRFGACCCIPLRIGLLFIAILSIVTGGMINAVIKKAGVNVSSIHEVRDLKTIEFEEATKSLLASRYTEANDNFQDVDTTKATRRQKSTTKPRVSTVEIIGEDGRTEIIRFQDDYDDHGDHDNHDDQYDDTESHEVTDPVNVTEAGNFTTEKVETESEKRQKQYTKIMGTVNRNGLNLLAAAFVALGIILLVANFLNSPEMALLYVALCLATCLVSLTLLVAVLGECARDHSACLLRKMDWFSGFMVSLFWFIYIFVWAFFAAVANGFASEMGRF